jgi:paraquat-inducible protein B
MSGQTDGGTNGSGGHQSNPSPQLPPQAVVRSKLEHKHRISWIWAIPIVTMIIGGWLAWKTLLDRGPLITITFQTAEGLTVNQSHVRHKEVDMGVVNKIELAKDLKHVLVTVRMSKEAEPLLTDKAQFWVVRPRFFAGNVSGLSTLFSGSYIDLLPSGEGGEPKREFTGLEEPPVLQSDVPGRTFLLSADRIGSLNLGSPIMYRDFVVGEVLGWDIGKMARQITIHAFIRAPFDQYVHDDSRFFNISGASVKLVDSGLQFQVESLRAILFGGISFDTPETSDVKESVTDHQFALFQDREAADASVYRRSVPFVANFTGSVAGLTMGSPVTLRGLKIGEVQSLNLLYDKASDSVIVPVHFKLEPERIAMLDLPRNGDLDVKMRQLVQRGLRIKLESANILTGSKQLTMDVVPNTSPGELRKENGEYVIPVVGGGGNEDVMAAASSLLARLNNLPFESIGQNLNQLLTGANSVVGGKQIPETLASLRATLASAQTLVVNLNDGIAPATERLPAIAAGLEQAVNRTNKLVVSLDNGYGGDSRFSRDATRLMSQLSDAAQSLRVLADLLTRHPEALIRGRAAQEIP